VIDSGMIFLCADKSKVRLEVIFQKGFFCVFYIKYYDTSYFQCFQEEIEADKTLSLFS